MSETRLISFDLDGTLLDANGRITELTMDALRLVEDKGIIIVINSGRPLYSAKIALKGAPYDYLVCGNGQTVYDHNETILYHMPDLEAKDLNTLFDLGARHFAVVNLDYPDLTMTGGAYHYLPMAIAFACLQQFHWIGKQLGLVKRKLLMKHNIKDLPPVEKISFASFNPILKKIYAEAAELGYQGNFVHSHWLEVQHKGISKGNALNFIQDHTNIPKEQCIAFGDGENDISMFEQCRESYALENGMSRCKEKATYLIGPHTADSVAHTLFNLFS